MPQLIPQQSLYLLFAGILVLFMVMGIVVFSAGLIRAKNTTALFANNMVVICVASMGFLGVGYQLMYLGHAISNPYFPNMKLLFSPGPHWGYIISHGMRSIDIAHAFFEFTLVSLAMVIIIGAMSERLKLWSAFWFAIFFVCFIYPIAGYWFRGGGFLQHIGFFDRAGAGIVFVTAGAASLAGLLLLGPRKGKYLPHNKVTPIPGCNLSLAFLGAMLFFIGSFGFNSGYLVHPNRLLDPQLIAMIFLNTLAAVSASLFVVLILSRFFHGKVDLTLLLNALIIGVISISANPAHLSFSDAALIGAGGGLLGMFAIILMDKIKIDDPIGAVATCLTGGIWSLIAVTFSKSSHHTLFWEEHHWTWLKQFLIQINGLVIIFFWVFITSMIVWGLIKLLFGLRVTPQEEIRGMDLYDCGVKAYPEFITWEKRF